MGSIERWRLKIITRRTDLSSAHNELLCQPARPRGHSLKRHGVCARPLAAVGQIVGGAGATTLANGPALVNPADRATANSLMRAMRFSEELCPPDQDATLGSVQDRLGAYSEDVVRALPHKLRLAIHAAYLIKAPHLLTSRHSHSAR